MGTPGLGYSLYLFDGIRGKHQTGINKPLYGYGIKLYDSRNMPDTPIIKDPVHSIEENTAGTVEFMLLAGATGTMMANNGGYNGEIRIYNNQEISKYVCYRQSEIVLCRSWLTANGDINEEEIWAGRVYSIKKDFEDNWSITAEGPLAYFNDFSAEETKYTQGTNAQFLITRIIGKKDGTGDIVGLYNSTVNALIGGGSGGSWRAITPTSGINGFSHIDTRIYVGYVDKLQWKAATYVSNSDNSFELSDGEKYSSILNSLLSRFGGHFEITYDYETKDGPTKGRSLKYINWYADKSYHKTSSESKQKIYFGLNLLDYKEDLEDTEFFTALYPMGSKQQKTETTVDGTTTTKIENIKITIEGTTVNKYHHSKDSKYIYDQTIVNEYGFIEKKEKWEIDNKEKLKDIATKYYEDMSIGEPFITINAFDLKNLINTDLNKHQYKSLESLYLYDQINIVGGNAQYTHYYNKEIPIVGIKIPLDKFPTNTEYTMTNKTQRKSGLAPGNLPGIKPEEKLPDPGKNENEKEDEKPKPDDSVEYLPPVGGELGIDATMAHYPPIVLRRSASRWECNKFRIVEQERRVILYNGTTFLNYPGNSSTVIPESLSYTSHAWMKENPPGSNARYTYEPVNWQYDNAACITTAKSSTYIADSSSIIFKNAADSSRYNQTVSEDEPFIFYSDDNRSTSSPITRQINMSNNEKSKYNDFYEHARVDAPTTDLETTNPLNSYDDAFKDYYEHKEADVNAGQPWRLYFNANKDQVTPIYTGETPDFKYIFINENCSTGFTISRYASELNSAINQLQIGDTMAEIGAELLVDPSVNYFDMKLNFTHGDLTQTVTPIYRHMMNYFTAASPSTTRNMGLLASWTNSSEDTTVIFYSFLNGASESPIPLQDQSDSTIDGVFSNSGSSAGTNVVDVDTAKELESKHLATISKMLNTVYNFTSIPAPDKDKLDARKSLLSKILATNDPYARLSDPQRAVVGIGKEEVPPFPSGIIGLNDLHALIEYGQYNNITLNNIRSPIDKVFKDAIKLKLIQNMVPLMIITKTKDVGSGQTKHGLIFSGGSYKTNPNSITKENDKFILSDDILLSSMTGATYVNPIMYTDDSLQDNDGKNALFEYNEDDDSVSIKNGQIVPSPTPHSTAPTLTLTKCGGIHTRQVSTGVYLVLGGPVQNSTFSWHTSWPAYFHSEPNGSLGSRTIRLETENSIWYTGPTMVYKKSDDKIELPESLDLSDTISGKYLENAASLLPIAIGSELFMKVNFAYIKHAPRKGGD